MGASPVAALEEGSGFRGSLTKRRLGFFPIGGGNGGSQNRSCAQADLARSIELGCGRFARLLLEAVRVENRGQSRPPVRRLRDGPERWQGRRWCWGGEGAPGPERVGPFHPGRPPP